MIITVCKNKRIEGDVFRRPGVSSGSLWFHATIVPCYTLSSLRSLREIIQIGTVPRVQYFIC